MKKKRRQGPRFSAALAGVLLLAVPAATVAQESVSRPVPFARAAPEEVGLSAEKLDEAVGTVHGWIEEGRIVGAVLLVVRAGKMVLHEAAGWSDREQRVPMRTDHILSMRSMTKPLVGTAILMLREEGKLELEDRVSRYLPSFDNARSREITIFQLLTHTSGITGDIYVATGGTTFRTLREAVDAVGAKGPEFPPGTEYSYSDPGSSTLGALIAERSGMAAEDYIRSRILEPLGMEDSFLVDDPASPRRARMASTYRRQAGDWVKYWDPTMAPIVPFFRASGGLHATALDYARFMAAMLGGGTFGGARLLAPESVALATQPHSAYVVSPGEQAERTGFYGLHWSVVSDRFRPVEPPRTAGSFGHGGSDGTIAGADPSRDLIIVYLTQSRGTDTTGEFVQLVYDALLN